MLIYVGTNTENDDEGNLVITSRTITKCSIYPNKIDSNGNPIAESEYAITVAPGEEVSSVYRWRSGTEYVQSVNSDLGPGVAEVAVDAAMSWLAVVDEIRERSPEDFTPAAQQ
jgi:hypothetical protein